MARLLLLIVSLTTAMCVLLTVRKPVTAPCAIPEVMDVATLEREVRAIADRHPGVFGVFVRVLETGEELSLNDGEFMAASCYKLPLGLLIYEMAARGEIDLSFPVAFQRDDWESGTGVLQATRPGQAFELRRLVELAIVESDNIAANMLIRFAGRQSLVDFYRETGASVLPTERNVSSPRDMAIFAEHLVLFARRHPQMGAELFSYLLSSRFKDRLPSGLPAEAKIANKIGTLPGVVNDVGIVVTDSITYVIAVMTKDTWQIDRAERAISEISSTVYRHISSRASSQTLGVGFGLPIIR